MDVVASFSRLVPTPVSQIVDGCWRLRVHVDDLDADRLVRIFAGGAVIHVARAGAPQPDGWCDVLVPLAELPVASVQADPRSAVMAVGLAAYPLARVEAEALWGELAAPGYRRLLESLLPDNYWAVEALFAPPGEVVISGWALRPLGAPAPRILVDGYPAEVSWRLPSPAAGYAHWYCDGAHVSGFVARAPVAPGVPWVRIDWAPDEAGPRARPRPYASFIGPDDRVPLPDQAAISRVSGPAATPTTYSNGGLSDVLALRDVALQHGLDPADSRLAVVEWGSGCGRMSRFLAGPADAGRFTGVDIDVDSVAWCSDHLPGRFLSADLYPPVSEIEDGSVDLVVSHSVLTHLTLDAARAWLSEVARWLRPTGLAILTANGNSSSLVMRSRDEAGVRSLLAAGFDDGQASTDLLGHIADESYYRVTLGTDDGWRRLIDESMDVISIHPAVTSGFQAAFVVRRRAGSAE